MKNLTLSIFLLMLCFGMTQAQEIKSDTLVTKKGSTYIGKVEDIRSSIILFRLSDGNTEVFSIKETATINGVAAGSAGFNSPALIDNYYQNNQKHKVNTSAFLFGMGGFLVLSSGTFLLTAHFLGERELDFSTGAGVQRSVDQIKGLQVASYTNLFLGGAMLFGGGIALAKSVKRLPYGHSKVSFTGNGFTVKL